MASERTETGREREEGSGEGRYSGKGVRGAGRREGNAGRERTRKKPNPLGLGQRIRREGALVPVESAVRSDSPLVRLWGWYSAHLARQNQCLIDGRLSRLERGGGDCPEISACGAVYVNVEGLHWCGLVKCSLA